MAFPNTFANATTATGAQLDANFNALSANNGSSLVGFLQSGTGAVSRTAQSKLQESVSVMDFGATGNGITDDTAAFQAALAAFKVVYVPPGAYNISNTLVLSQGGAKLIGDGHGTTQITAITNNLPLITINTGLTSVEIKGLTLTRNGTLGSASPGANGITFVSTGQAILDDLLITNHYVGVTLSSTDYSTFQNSWVQYNALDGVYLQNTSTDGAVQWQINNVLSSRNGRHGFYMQSIAGVAGITPGTWTNIASFANSGRGAIFLGLVGTPINDIRIVGGFLGSDGNSEIYLDTYGGSHVITGVTVERAGMDATGPTLGTAASGIGSGIEATSNNLDIQISGSHSVTNSLDGYYLAGTSTTIGNCTAKNNGNSLTAGRRNGVNSVAGRCIVSGGFYGNTGAGTAQAYGVFTANGNNLSVLCSDLTNNSTSSLGATANQTFITQIGNLPNTIDTIFPASAVLVGGGATGGTANGAGTINLAGGILKNNLPYIPKTAAPTIASGFGTGPSIPVSFGTSAFQINVGTGGTASSGVLTMPAAPTGWIVLVEYNGSSINMNTYCTPTSTTSVTLTNQTSSSGATVAWPSGTVLNCMAVAY